MRPAAVVVSMASAAAESGLGFAEMYYQGCEYRKMFLQCENPRKHWRAPFVA